MKKTLVAAVATVLLGYFSTAQAADPGTTAAAFLKIEPGARAEGMGEAFTAVADDIDAIAWNPAGLGGLTQREASFVHNKIEEDVSLEYLAYVQPLGDLGTMAASLNYLWMSGLPVTSVSSPDGTGDTFSAN